MDVLGSRTTSFWTSNDFLFNMFPWSGKDKYNETLKAINKFSDEAIRKRVAHLLKNDKADGKSDDDSAEKIVFIDLLLQGSVDGQPLGNDAILDQVNTLTFNVMFSLLFCWVISNDY